MPTIKLENGARITLDDGATDADIEAAVNDYMSSQQAQPAAAEQPTLTPQEIDQKLPIRNTSTGMPNGAPLPYGMDQAMLDASDADVRKKNAQSIAMRNDPSFLSQVKSASDEGFFKNMLKGAENTSAEFGAGVSDLMDKYLPESVANALNYVPFQENNPQNLPLDQRMAARKDAMAGLQQDQAARQVGAPVSSTIGSMAPYLVTGEGASKALDVGIKALSPITRSLVEKSLTAISPDEAMRFANRPSIPSDFGRRAAFAAKAPAIGAAEGSANYNQTAGQGAFNSALGSAIGLAGPLTKLSRVENVRDANTKNIINDMHREGFALTPGVRTGNRQMQTEEAGMRNSDMLGDYYHQTVTRPNQRKMTEMAGDAIGLDGKGRDTFSVNELGDHMNNLRTQYGKLEATTTGVLTPAHSADMGRVLKELQPTSARNTSPADAARYAQVKSVLQQINAETRSAGAGSTAKIFDGTKYQQLRQRVQDEAQQAFSSGDNRLGNSLKSIQKTLDSSLEQGMGKAKASEWKDLNERYAMTNMLVKNGVTPTGAVSPMGITSAVMGKDEAMRTMTGQGGRIKQFQKMARYNDILDNVEGGSLTGLGKADMSADRSLTKLPIKYRLPMYARATGAYRLGRIPTYGLGPTAGVQVGRAIGMTEPLDKINRALHGAANDLRDWYNSPDEDKK